jgi:hypothetical protein
LPVCALTYLYISIYICRYICTPTYRHTYMHRYILISRIISRTVIHHRLIDTTRVRTHSLHAFPFRTRALALRWSTPIWQIAGAVQQSGFVSGQLRYAGAPIGSSLPVARCWNGRVCRCRLIALPFADALLVRMQVSALSAHRFVIVFGKRRVLRC